MAYWLSATNIRAVATLVSYDVDRLLLIIESIRLQLDAKSAYRLAYVKKRNHTYSKILKQYCDANFVSEYPIRYGEDNGYDTYDSVNNKRACMQKVDRSRRRLMWYNTKINNNILAPTNGTVGHMLSIPKGTVDSILHTIRQRYTNR